MKKGLVSSTIVIWIIVIVAFILVLAFQFELGDKLGSLMDNIRGLFSFRG